MNKSLHWRPIQGPSARPVSISTKNPVATLDAHWSPAKPSLPGVRRALIVKAARANGRTSRHDGARRSLQPAESPLAPARPALLHAALPLPDPPIHPPRARSTRTMPLMDADLHVSLAPRDLREERLPRSLRRCRPHVIFSRSKASNTRAPRHVARVVDFGGLCGVLFFGSIPFQEGQYE